jgi:hypothetical protein
MPLLTELENLLIWDFYRDFSPTGFSFFILHSSFFILHSAFASRPGQFIKDFLDDRFAGFHPGPGFVSDGKNALKIAQPFMAGVLAHGHPKVPSGTKEMVCRPWRDLKIGLPVFPAINGWAIFVKGSDLIVSKRVAILKIEPELQNVFCME